MTIHPSNYPEGLPPLDAGRWSDVVRAIELDGGPVTPHPDAETIRLRGLTCPKPHLEPAPIGPVLRQPETPMELDEDPPAPIPARPYVLEPAPPSRRGWFARLLRRRFA